MIDPLFEVDAPKDTPLLSTKAILLTELSVDAPACIVRELFVRVGTV